jgi:hypothetical protein
LGKGRSRRKKKRLPSNAGDALDPGSALQSSGDSGGEARKRSVWGSAFTYLHLNGGPHLWYTRFAGGTAGWSLASHYPGPAVIY